MKWPATASSETYLAMVTQLLILAGGKGTRLAAVAGDLPKPLVSVGGRPLLGHHLDLARRHGFRSVRIFAGYRAEQIAEFVHGDDTLVILLYRKNDSAVLFLT